MKKVLIDTNIMIDLLAKREEFYLDSKQIFSLADNNKIQLVISALSLANTHYLLNDVLKLKDARSIISKFKVLVQTYALTDKIVELALHNLSFKDFEDGIQYHTAIESKCKGIITRNTKDYKNSSIPVLQPKEYLIRINNR